MNEKSNHPEIAPPPSEPSYSPDSTPLDHVIDDLEPKLAWNEWVVEEMTKGRSPDDLTADMVASGWSDDDAADLVETARRRTRHLRGVVTREEVARANAARYHKATALNWFSMFRMVSTTFVTVTSARNLLYSLSVVFSSRRRRPNTAAGFSVEPAKPQSNTSTAESDEQSP